MNVSANALNLTDFAQLVDAPVRQRETAFSMIQGGSIMRDVKIVTDPDIEIRGSRVVGGLAAVDWVPLNNSEPTVVKTIPKEFSEQSYMFANAIQINRIKLMAAKKRGKSGTDLFNMQGKAFIKSFGYDFNDAFFNNAHEGAWSRIDLDCFVGLKPRLMDQSGKYGNNAECVINANGASGVDLSDGAIAAATGNRLLSILQEALDVVGEAEGDDCIVYMNDDLFRRFAQAVRLLGGGGGFNTEKDAFDRTVMTFGNAKIRRAGRKAPAIDGTQAQIITSTENAAGTADTGGTFTSLYVVKTGEEDLFIQQAMPMEPTDPYLLENRTMFQMVFQNAYAFVQPNTRAAVRVRNIKVA